MRQQTLDFLCRLKSAYFPDYVVRLVVFGSEVNNTTGVGSDIDLGIISESSLNRAQRIAVDSIIMDYEPPFEYDLVFVVPGEYRGNFDVRRDICEKGCVVYERGKHLFSNS